MITTSTNIHSLLIPWKTVLVMTVSFLIFENMSINFGGYLRTGPDVIISLVVNCVNIVL